MSLNLKYGRWPPRPSALFCDDFPYSYGLSTTGVTFYWLEDLTLLQAMLLIASICMANSGSWVSRRLSGGHLLLLHCDHCYWLGLLFLSIWLSSLAVASRYHSSFRLSSLPLLAQRSYGGHPLISLCFKLNRDICALPQCHQKFRFFLPKPPWPLQWCGAGYMCLVSTSLLPLLLPHLPSSWQSPLRPHRQCHSTVTERPRVLRHTPGLHKSPPPHPSQV